MNRVRRIRFRLASAIVLTLGMLAVAPGGVQGKTSAVTFKKICLSKAFYAEGAGIGDIDKDGHADAVYGPYWHRGPEFSEKFPIYPPEEFDPKSYSNNFITFLSDVNEDGWIDVLVNVWPGKEVAWFENPQTKGGSWARHIVHPVVDNESPCFADVTGDGKPELIFHTAGELGFAQPRSASEKAPWAFHACSEKESWGQYTHGLGTGDVNGDGRIDLLMAGGWWEQPDDVRAYPWIKHPFPFGKGGAQMHAYDVDGDGDNDVVTSIQAHGYGLAWFEQTSSPDGPRFVERSILSSDANVQLDDVQFSQLHAVELADVNGDGLQDIVTGKRYWAHGPTGDADPQGPAVLYWFELKRSEKNGVTFVPHRIDDDSGVGTQFAVGDLDGDRRVDIVIGNKKGGYVFLQQGE